MSRLGRWNNAQLERVIEDAFFDPATGLPFTPAQVTGLKRQVRRGNRVGGLGDSIMIGGGTITTGEFGVTSFLTWLGLLSGGRCVMVKGGNSGVPGQTSEAMLARMDTDIAPLGLDYLDVLAGTNDLGAGRIPAQIILTLADTYSKAEQLGIQPIANTLTPRNSAEGASIPELNYRIASLAAKRSIPLIDLYPVLLDPTTGGIGSAFSNDGLHPNIGAGAKLLGQAAADAMATIVAATPSPLAKSGVDATNLIANPLFVGDTNADGIANSWSLSGATGGTPSIVADAAIIGNWQKLVGNGVVASPNFSQTINAAGYSVGDRLRFAGRIRATVAGTTTKPMPRVRFVGSSPAQYLSPSYLLTAGTSTTDFASCVFAIEGVIPAGTTSIIVDLQAGQGTGTVEFAQISLVNQNRLGVV